MPILLGGVYKNDKGKKNIEELFDCIPHSNSSLLFHHYQLLCLSSNEKWETDYCPIHVVKDRLMQIGDIYDKKTYNNSYFTSHDADTIIKTKGNYLGDKKWGAYVVILLHDNKYYICCDPLKSYKVYYFIHKDVLLFLTKLWIVQKFAKQQLNIAYLNSFICKGTQIPTQDTPFRNIFFMPNGSYNQITSSGVKTLNVFWNLKQYLNINKKKSYTELKQIIYTTFENVIKTQIKNKKNIKVHLSGGLDSSSLLKILGKIKNPDQNITAYTMYDPLYSSSDETLLAKKYAKESNINWVGLKTFKESNFTNISLEHNRPFTMTLLQHHTSVHDKNQQYLWIDGYGGDMLFMSFISDAFITDLLLEGRFKKIFDFYLFKRKSFISLIFKDCIPSIKKSP